MPKHDADCERLVDDISAQGIDFAGAKTALLASDYPRQVMQERGASAGSDSGYPGA